MTIQDILNLIGIGSGAELRNFLVRVGEAAPDLKPQADQFVAALDAGLSVENLVALASALPAEIADIAQGKVDPRNHPSDSI